MLVRFGIENFKSFASEHVLDLQANERHKENLDFNAFVPAVAGQPRILKVAAIFGPNASGKSNVLKAMQILRRMVLRERMPDGREAISALQPFAFCENPFEKPTNFEVEIQVDGVSYAYDLSIHNGLVSYEALKRKEAFGRWQRVFVRQAVRPLGTEEEKKLFLDASVEELYRYSYGRHFSGPKKNWETVTSPDATFLGTASVFAAKPLKPVFNWFKSNLVVLNELESLNELFTIEKLATDPDMKAAVVNFLKSADLGLSDVMVEKLRVPGKAFHVDPLSGRAEVRNEEHEVFQVGLKHTVSGREWTLPFGDESMGTRRMLHLAGPLIDMMKKEITLFVDELETSLHPILVEKIVEAFESHAMASSGSQLIMTTHCDSLLENDTRHPDSPLLRRDQVWFTDKNSKLESRLYSLDEFQPRKNESIKLGYRSGRYRGVPFIDELSVGGDE